MTGGWFVWRVKRKSVLRKGRLPELRVWVVEGAHHLVCVFYGGTLRIYYVDKLGKMLGAEEFTGRMAHRNDTRQLRQAFPDRVLLHYNLHRSRFHSIPVEYSDLVDDAFENFGSTTAYR